MEPLKNNSFMKKIILLTVSCIFILNATAQFSATITKKILGQNSFICTTLTNNSGHLLLVIDGSVLRDDGGIINYGCTYVIFSCYDSNNILLETSKKIPFTLTTAGEKRPVIKFPAGQSWSSNRILFSTIGCYGIFSNENSANLKYINAKVHICYAKPDTDKSFTEFEIEVNQLNL